jgi:ABC-2 type transport system permease protein
MLISFGLESLNAPLKYWINDSSPQGAIAEKLLIAATASEGHKEIVKETVSGKEIRYVDWLIAGLLSMNMMFSALFGVGYVIVRYRKNGVLRRFKATPVTAFEFLSAQVASRFVLIGIVSSFIFVCCKVLIGFQMIGSYFSLILVYSLGALCLISLGLLVSARVRSEELASGILNLLTWPMMFFSGIWFSLEGTNPTMQKLASVFPLTHVTQAARSIMLEGATLSMVAPHLVVLAGLTIVFVTLGSVLFSWD